MTDYLPNWASPPGDTILDLLEERKWTKEELASRLDLTCEDVKGLLSGDIAITTWLARSLEHVFGAPAGFWLSRDAKYYEASTRLSLSNLHG